jgi:hypothetical protein
MYILSITTVITGPVNNGNKTQTEKELQNLRRNQENCCPSGFKVERKSRVQGFFFHNSPLPEPCQQPKCDYLKAVSWQAGEGCSLF